MTTHDDRELRREFEALRLEEAGHTPPFHATVAAARRRPRPSVRRRALVLAVGAALAGVALVLALKPRAHGARIDLATLRWHSPTDFLLRLPGDQLLRTVPTLGVTPSTITWRIP